MKKTKLFGFTVSDFGKYASGKPLRVALCTRCTWMAAGKAEYLAVAASAHGWQHSDSMVKAQARLQ